MCPYGRVLPRVSYCKLCLCPFVTYPFSSLLWNIFLHRIARCLTLYCGLLGALRVCCKFRERKALSVLTPAARSSWALCRARAVGSRVRTAPCTPSGSPLLLSSPTLPHRGRVPLCSGVDSVLSQTPYFILEVPTAPQVTAHAIFPVTKVNISKYVRYMYES